MGGQDCSQGHFTMIFWGMGPPQAKLLSNRGRRAAGHSLLLSQEASPRSKDRANTPRKTLEGQGNADESEKKWIQLTHQPVSHPQEENPATTVGRSLCLQAGQDFYSVNRGWAVHLNLSLFCKQDKPISKEWASPKATWCYSWLHFFLVTAVSKDFSHAAAEVLIPHGPAWHRKWEGNPRRGAEVWLPWLCPGGLAEGTCSGSSLTKRQDSSALVSLWTHLHTHTHTNTPKHMHTLIHTPSSLWLAL